MQSPSKKGDDGSTIGALRIATAIVAKPTRLNAAYDNSNACNIFDIILFRFLDANISKKIYISKGNCVFSITDGKKRRSRRLCGSSLAGINNIVKL